MDLGCSGRRVGRIEQVLKCYLVWCNEPERYLHDNNEMLSVTGRSRSYSEVTFLRLTLNEKTRKMYVSFESTPGVSIRTIKLEIN